MSEAVPLSMALGRKIRDGKVVFMAVERNRGGDRSMYRKHTYTPEEARSRKNLASRQYHVRRSLAAFVPATMPGDGVG